MITKGCKTTTKRVTFCSCKMNKKDTEHPKRNTKQPHITYILHACVHASVLFKQLPFNVKNLKRSILTLNPT